jgi:DNA-binding NarL/FixJ family response regulator
MNRRLIWTILAILLVGVVLAVVEVLRATEPVTVAFILSEGAEKLVLVLGMASVAWTMQGVSDLREGQVALSNNIARAVAQGDAWRSGRKDEIAALGNAIGDQFRQWQLTPAEIDIAGLMLKGASLKEIALARETSEATIRQQAQSIYRKSGLSGRAELSAYFLESLFETSEDARQRQAGLTLVRPAG